MGEVMKKIIELIYIKIEQYFCYHGSYLKWKNGVYGEFYETNSSCWICNTRRGKVYLYFYEKLEQLIEVRY